MGDRMKERVDADLYDLYNGDDGPGFDEEFHAQLLSGAHLLNNIEHELFMMGWKAAKEFYESKED